MLRLDCSVHRLFPLFREIVDVDRSVPAILIAFCTIPSFARIKGPRWRPVEHNDRGHVRSHGKIYKGL